MMYLIMKILTRLFNGETNTYRPSTYKVCGCKASREVRDYYRMYGVRGHGGRRLSASTDSREWLVEVKTVCKRFDTLCDKSLFPLLNKKWIYAPVEGGVRYWMLNAINSDLTPGKGARMIAANRSEDGVKVALAYLFKDGILYFGPNVLLEAATVCGIYRCSERCEFEPEKCEETEQVKIMVNLEKGKWIPCDVPEELFRKTLHPDFNRLNKNSRPQNYIS